MTITAFALLTFSAMASAHLKGCYPYLCDPPEINADGGKCSPFPECTLYPDSLPTEDTDQNGRKCYTRPWVCKPPM